MKTYLIDTHSHIDMIDEAPEVIIKEMLSFDVKKAIIPSIEISTMEKIVALSEKYNELYSMVGIYPNETKTYTDEIENKMKNLAKSNKVRAIGEIGLDYYWDTSFIDIQKDIFARQIHLANKLNLPIVVHNREAHRDTFDILKSENKSSKVLYHCFSGSVEYMKECVKEGYLIAIGGVVTFKNAIKIKDVVKEVPLENLVLETDSPYLTPVPYRGKRNKPAYVKYIAEEIAKIRGMDIKELINITTINAERFFNI